MNSLNMFAIVVLAMIVAFASATPVPEPHKFGGVGVAYPVGIASVPVAVPVPIVPVIQPVPVVAAPVYGGFYG